MSKRSSLTSLALVLYALWQLVGILSTLVPILLPIYLFGMVVLIGALINDFGSLADPDEFEVTIAGPSVAELGTQVQLHYDIAPVSKAAAAHRVDLHRPSAQILKFPPSPTVCAVGMVDECRNFAASLVGRAEALGRAAIDTARIVQTSQWQLWRRTMDCACPQLEVRVTPSSERVPEQVYQELVSHQRSLSQGTRLVMKARAADQFYSIRRYQFPDSLRHIDQKKSAKYGQLMTRTYEAVHNHHLVLALDTGRSMYGSINGSSKQDYYVAACIHLAQNALSSGDRVSMLAFSQKPHLQIAGARSLSAFRGLYRGDIALRAREEDSDYSLLNRMVPKLSSQRCILVVLTDTSHPYVQQSMLTHLAPLCRSHLAVVVSLLDQHVDVANRVRVATENAHYDEMQLSTLLYGYWLQEQLALFQNSLNRFGGAAVTVPDRYWLSTVGRVYQTLRTSLRA